MLRITHEQWNASASPTQLVNLLREQGELDESECYIDATFASAKGGGEQIGPTRRSKGVKITAIVDRPGLLPLAPAALCILLKQF